MAESAQDRGTGGVVTVAACANCWSEGWRAGILSAQAQMRGERMSGTMRAILDAAMARADADPANGLQRMLEAIVDELHRTSPVPGDQAANCCRGRQMSQSGPRRRCTNYALPAVER